MTSFSSSLRLQEAAIIRLDPLNPVVSMILFHYKTETLTRTPQSHAARGANGDRSEMLELEDAPVKTGPMDSVRGRHTDSVYDRLDRQSSMRRLANAL